ncbi:MAG: AraC family transcriptional regulator, partial [Chitinophagaceae bacterium]
QHSGGLDQLTKFLQLLGSLSGIHDVEALAPDIKLNSVSDYEGARLSNTYNYIMQHYNRDITLEEVAGAAYMTPQAFCRYFKKHTRVTFVTFLNEIRINEACKKLIDGSYNSVSSVAYDCGFNSITNFNRVFKSTTGKSPREYVSMYLNNVS